MNRYRAYMDRAGLTEDAHRRMMDALAGPSKARRPRRLAHGALAACCALAVLAGTAGLIRWTGLPAPMAAVTPAASDAGVALSPAPSSAAEQSDHTLVVDDPFDGQTHGFYSVPSCAFPDCTGGPAVTAENTALPGGYFEETLTAEEIIHALGGDTEVPWDLLWAGFGLDGTVIYDGQGAVWLAYINGENGDTALSLRLSPDDLPPVNAIYEGAAEEVVNGITVTTYCLETEGEDGTAAWAYHVQMLAGDTGIDFTCTSPDRDQANWLANVFICHAVVTGGTLTTRGLEPDEIPEWRSAALTLEEARAEDLGAYLPGTPAGFTFEWAWRELGQGRDWLSAGWVKGMDNFTVQISRPETPPDCLDPADTARYDVNLYTVPWSESVPEEIMFGGFQDPVFRAEDMTPEIIAARARWEDQDAGDIDGWRYSQFSVWHSDAGVLVTYAGRGIAPEALAELILG